MYPDSSQQLTYETDDEIFWFSGPFDVFNNWSAHRIEIWDMRFPTVEHAFHYAKFYLNHPRIANEVLNSSSPWAAKRIADKHADKRRDDWFDVSIQIMTDLIRAKANQNEDVKKILLSTGNKIIIEHNPWNSFWGSGKDKKGQNHVGRILMKVRDELRDA